jgi:uncharacterized protein (TIGR02757 family)
LDSLPKDAAQLKEWLDAMADHYNRPPFITDDPICIPHRFSKQQDVEIAGFIVAMLAWGRRQTIISKASEFIELMEGEPYRFVMEHSEEDRKAFLNFKHRTFQPTDALYFLAFLQHHYQNNKSLESAFTGGGTLQSVDVGPALIRFHKTFFSLPWAPERTKKHVATPERGSSCKRLNMFLRWMVRNDKSGVDLGVWKEIHPRQLLMPLDVHVGRVARRLGLLNRKASDWKAVLELTEAVRILDKEDPVRYDFALFGSGVLENHESNLSSTIRNAPSEDGVGLR